MIQFLGLDSPSPWTQYLAVLAAMTWPVALAWAILRWRRPAPLRFAEGLELLRMLLFGHGVNLIGLLILGIGGSALIASVAGIAPATGLAFVLSVGAYAWFLLAD